MPPQPRRGSGRGSLQSKSSTSSRRRRQARREQILGTTQKDFRAFAEVLEAVKGEAGRVVAVTSAEKAKAALEQRPGFFEVKKVL